MTSVKPAGDSNVPDNKTLETSCENGGICDMERLINGVIRNLGHHGGRKRSRTQVTEAPYGLESEFSELLASLRKGLIPSRGRARNVSVLIMGKRGSGKSMLLNQCLAALGEELLEKHQHKDENNNERLPKSLRIVHLNGILLAGTEIYGVVKEIVRQLNNIALAEQRQNESSSAVDVKAGRDESNEEQALKSSLDAEKMFRAKKTSLSSMLSFMDEAFMTACIDKLPILVILEELDSFAGNSSSLNNATSSNRQVLLYHLLERVSSPGSSISLVGTTCQLTTTSLFEKRVRSRAEGTSQTIVIGYPKTYEDLVSILLKSFEVHGEGKSNPLKDILERILFSLESEEAESDSVRVGNAFRLCHKEGKDLRWFSQVLHSALSLLLTDYSLAAADEALPPCVTTLLPRYLLENVALNGDIVDSGADNFGARARSDTKHVIFTPRFQMLLDLSGPQLTVLLSARRVLARDSQHEESLLSLTFNRIYGEYETFRRRTTTGVLSLSKEMLFRSFLQLIDMGLLRPAADSQQTGPLQYNLKRHYLSMDSAALGQLPLHVTLDMEKEVDEALKNNNLKCSTALREWGMRRN